MSGLPEGWAMMPLGEIATRTKNLDPSKHPYELFELFSVPSFFAGGPEYLKGAEIGSTKQEVEPDDILLCKIVPHINRVWVVPPVREHRQIGSGEWIVYRDHFCEPHYLRYCLTEENFRNQFLGTSSGVGGSLTRARPEAVSRIEVPIAPLPEQKRIVAKVDGLTARTARARSDLARIPTLIARYKQRLLALAFSGELTASWRASRELPVPKLALLSDILAIPVRNGLSVRGSDDPPGVRALRLSALRGAEVNLNDVRYLPIGPQQASRFLLREGDILISRGNGTRAFVGIGSRVPALAEETIFPDTAFRIRLDPDCASPRRFVSIWNSPQVREQIENSAKTTAGIWKIAQTDMARVQILLPTPQEQTEITRRIESAFNWLDRMAADHAAAAKLLPKLDAAILTRAFRGALVPQDPVIPPESKGLDK